MVGKFDKVGRVGLVVVGLALCDVGGPQSRPQDNPYARVQQREVTKAYVEHLAFLKRIRCRTIGDLPHLRFEGVDPVIKAQAIHETVFRRGSHGTVKRWEALYLLIDTVEDCKIDPEVAALCLSSLDPEIRRAGALGLHWQEDAVRWKTLGRFTFPKNPDAEKMLVELRKPTKSVDLNTVQDWMTGQAPPAP